MSNQRYNASAPAGHFISVIDEESGAIFNFLANKASGLRYLGVHTDPPQDPPVVPHTSWVQSATQSAHVLATANGWI